ncbi:MAG: N-acetyltransferase [Weeksellaceae bacterium]|nr:N-acetyltransferase [Weeksellaceae bacterium]
MEIIYTQTVNDGQFTIYEGDEIVGYIKYEWAKNGNINATGTFIDEKYRGQGLGENLMEELIELAEQNDVQIYPICPYVIHYFEKHPEFEYLLDEEYLESLKDEE